MTLFKNIQVYTYQTVKHQFYGFVGPRKMV